MWKAVCESGEVTVLNYFECSPSLFFCPGTKRDGITYKLEEFLLHLTLLFGHTAQVLKGILPNRRGKSKSGRNPTSFAWNKTKLSAQT